MDYYKGLHPRCVSLRSNVIQDQISRICEKEDSVILNELSTENILCEWLNFQQLDFHVRLNVLKLIAKASSFAVDRRTHCKFIQKLVSLKAPLITFLSVFLSTAQGQQRNDCDIVLLLKLVFDVVHTVFQCLPVSSMDFIDIILPQLELSLKKNSGELTAELVSNVAELLQQKKNICPEVNGSKEDSEKEQELSPPPSNFRDTTLLPDKQEIECQVRPYLRPNVVKGPYENVDHYLDVQFRLMREDMFRHLRESIAEYKSKEWSRGPSALLQNGHIYFDVRITRKKYFNGIFFTADAYIGKIVDWETTKRLMSNSLLCMSRDGFQTFIFAYVHSCTPARKNPLSCLLQFSVEDRHDAECIELGKVYDIIETTSFYESYRYVLKRLQQFDDDSFPLSSSILFLKDCDKQPEYWKKPAFLPELQSEKDTYEKMLRSGNERFDEHQQKAFQMALSNRISMIQGPPGTGKTYLGLEIVKWLVQNASKHMGGPVLVICYTNHALDQFLEGVLTFTQKVVRIGGQSKNIWLEPYHVSNIVNALLKRHSEEDPLGEIELESRRIGLNILGGLPFLERVGRYTVTVRQTEKKLVHLEQLIFHLDDDPLYNETVMIQILPRHLRQEILGSWNSYKGTDSLSKLLTKGLENWLCISASFLHVYEDLPEFLLTVIKELLRYFEGHDRLDTKTNSEKLPENQHNTDPLTENEFITGLWNLFLKTKDLKSFEALKIMPSDINHQVKHFLREHVLNKKIVFRFLEKAASKCLDQTGEDLKLETHQIWSNSLLARWAIFFEWKSSTRLGFLEELILVEDIYEKALKERERVRFRNSLEIAKNADILGLTTTGAAKYSEMLQQIGSRVVVVEEAAEVLEAHITTALTKCTEHLILIGDHKQLRPIPSVYDLAKEFKLDVSMFERLLTNGAPSQCLQTQHRMRPCIAELLVPEIYDNLENHPSVLEYEDIKGMTSNMYFVKHRIFEDSNVDLRSRKNKHEARFLVALYRYLLQQGYEKSSITVLTTYCGQLQFLREIMNRRLAEDAHVTTVDNFQGEENDIILLSFVRSNWKNCLGFLEIRNRICVALSRARKGLFCIGNFDSFAEKCCTWRKIVEKLEKMQLISSALPLRCQNHPEKITLASCASDFDKVLQGGCMEKCPYRLLCGHACPHLCHAATEGHDIMTCSKKCRNKCQKESRRLLQVSKNTSEEFSSAKSPQNVDENTRDNCNGGDYDESGLAGYLGIVRELYTPRATTFRRKSPNPYLDLRVGRELEITKGISAAVTAPDKTLCFQGSPCVVPHVENHYPVDLSGKLSTFMVKYKADSTSEIVPAESHCGRQKSDVGSKYYRGRSETVLPQMNSLSCVPGSSPHLSCAVASKVAVSMEMKKEANLREECASNYFLKNAPSLLDLAESDSSGPQNKKGITPVTITDHNGDFAIPKEDCELTALPTETSECELSCDRIERNSPAVMLSTYSESNEMSIVAEGASSSSITVSGDQSSDLSVIARKDNSDNPNSSYKEKNIEFKPNDLNAAMHFSCEGDCFMLHEPVLLDRRNETNNSNNLKHRITQHDRMQKSQEHTEKQAFSFDCKTCDHKKMQCDALITKKLHCQHDIRVLCNQYNLKHDCKYVVEVQLSCIHSLSVRCSDWIWMKEIRCTYEENLLMPCGKLIQYICSEGPNHADCTAIVLKCGHKVPCYTNVDEYRCDVPIKCVLPCSHLINVPCTLHYYVQQLASSYEISESEIAETKIALLQNLCGNLCYFLMECGHRCLGKCATCKYKGKHVKCYEIVKRNLPCNHQLECRCHIKDPSCALGCETVLTCGHQCQGQCGQCFKFQIHAMCLQKVDRHLPCGHSVKLDCGSPLPTCERRCLFGCQHSRCINSCSYPCTKCPKPCEWKCEHFACSRQCSELCDRPACEARCPKVLTCGHQCAGYCGEPCPNVCLLCDGVSTADTQVSSNWYVLLEDCQHSIVLDNLNSYFKQKSQSSCPLCPQCGTVITRNRRFGNCIKSWLAFDLHNYRLESSIHGSGTSERRAFNSDDSDIFDKFASEMIQRNISFTFIPNTMKMCRNVSILRQVLSREFLLSTCGFLDVFNSLKRWLLEHGSVCGEQQVEECCRAVRRLCALFFLKAYAVHKLGRGYSDSGCSEAITVLESNPFGEDEEERLMELLRHNKLKTEGKSGHLSCLMSFIEDLNAFQKSPKHQKIDFSNYFGVAGFSIHHFED